MDDYKNELVQVSKELQEVESELQDLLDRQTSLSERKAELEAIIQQNEDMKEQNSNKTWDGSDFPWSADLDQKLKNVFKLRELRPMQRQAMNVTMSGEDCLLIMPTGGGKSLCFQLPAVISTGLTLVVSPLVSLMEDQQIALEELDVPSAILNASTDKDMIKTVQDDMVNVNGKLRLLYVTPEKLAKSKRFMNRLEKCYAIGHLSRLVIDEVHCCSQWGHDFRPDYKFLGIMKRQFPNAPILGLTATATTNVLEDVKKILNIPRAILLKASFNRPNLFYEVQPKPSAQKDAMDLLHNLIVSRFRGMSGIVYCFSRKDSEEVTSELMSRGVKAGCYHGDIDAKSRSRVHRLWLSGGIQVVVATVAFGMGIDKPDVRFVIHYSISKSMENLYQESGRAGRDDKKSNCIVLYRLADAIKQSTMVFTEQTGLNNLHGIIAYCTNTSSCRRSLIAKHFGEVWESSHCNVMCDNCVRERQGGTSEKRDVTRHCTDVITLLDSASASDSRLTSAKLVDAWFGRGPSILRVKSVPVPSISQDKAEKIIAHMLVEGFLQEDFHFTAYSTICYLLPGPKAKMLRSKVTKVIMNFPGKGSSTNSSPSSASSSTTLSCSGEKKPKLVMVNKEKSHFSDMKFSPPPESENSVSQEKANMKKSSSSSSKVSNGETKQMKKDTVKKLKPTSQKTALEPKSKSSSTSRLEAKVVVCDGELDDMDLLDFDDLDVKPSAANINRQMKKESVKQSNSPVKMKDVKNGDGYDCEITESDSKNDNDNSVVISDDEDGEDFQPSSKNVTASGKQKGKAGLVRKAKKRKSVVISDDEDDSDTSS